MNKINSNHGGLNVLITSPSLDTHDNVSGISTLVRLVIRNSGNRFFHFTAGRKDNEDAGLYWMVRQLFLPINFARDLFNQRIDIVHLNTALEDFSILRDFSLAMTARFFGKPLLVHLHGGKYMHSAIPGVALHWIIGELLSSANTVLVQSETERRHLKESWPDTDATALPNAVNIEDTSANNDKTSLLEIVFFGRIENSKGLDEIVSACRMLNDSGVRFQFKCYGSGARQESFSRSMKKVLRDRFEYLGVVSGEKKSRALERADVFLLPSHYEGLPLSMLEAMAAGCTVVVSDVGSISTVVEDGKNGFMVEPRNVTQIVEKIDFILSGKADLEEIGGNARKTVESRYSIDNYVERLERVYDEIVHQ